MTAYELLQHLGEVDPVDPALLDSIVGEVLDADSRQPGPTPFGAYRASPLFDAPALVRPFFPAGTHAPIAPRAATGAAVPRRRGHLGVPGRARGPALWATAVGTAAVVSVMAVLLASGALPTHGVAHGPRQAPGWRLVDAATSPFAAVGAAPTQAGSLECVTATTCFANAYPFGPGTASGFEQTTDGGRSWHLFGAVPGSGGTLRPFSCPTAQMCMGVAYQGQALTLVATTDGGAHWSVDSLAGSTTLPAGVGPGNGHVACATAEVCVVSAGRQMFVTRDGGAVWAHEPPLPGAGLIKLRCSADGTCIGLEWGGTANAGTLVAARSTDFGKTWRQGPSGPIGGVIGHMTCADTTHCMAAYPTQAGIEVTSTADGGRSWQSSTVPGTSSSALPTDLVCVTGEDCWIAGSPYSQSQAYYNAFVYQTRNAGATWTALPLPLVQGAPLAVIRAMSCPDTLGCIAVGQTSAQFHHRRVPGQPVRPPSSQIISDLPAA